MYLILYSLGLSDNNIVLGKHSGRHAFRARLTELGYTVSEDELNRAFLRFKDLADKKKEITNPDIESIVNDELFIVQKDRYKLVNIQVLCGQRQIPTATATILDEENGQEATVSAIGTGPVDATFKAIRMTVPLSTSYKLLEYTVSSVTAGIDALADVTTRVQDEETLRVAVGRSTNTDVIVASAQSYMNAINRLVLSQGQKRPVHPQYGRT